ncbi:MAG: PulJ/GspJ family protein, partial [Waterburya sp.]
MKNKEFYKLLKKNQSNSGFTLIELLVGLVMSIFVIGALGFGLMTVLQTNQRENSKVKARTENSRALDFISDEVRRARNIESETTINAPRFPASADKTVVLALDIPEISDSETMDSDKDADTKDERIVYYLSSNIGPNWKGPQVLYRWGPQLEANGSYVAKKNVLWDSQALIDGINITLVTNPCSTGTVSTENPTGFYACISLQDATKSYDPDSLIPDPLNPSENIQNPNYNPRNTAQLFLTGQTKTAIGVNDNQTNDTQVVARARTVAANSTDKNSSVSWSVKGLGGNFACRGTNNWDMRTDFGNDPDNSDNTTRWVQDTFTARQPQPIPINPGAPLAITSSAVGEINCDNNDRGNLGANNQNNLLSTYTNRISHTIDFGNPTTYNGDHENGTYNNPK